MWSRARREYWTSEYWRRYCESDNPYRRYKSERDESLAIGLLKPSDGELVLEVGCGYGRISRSLLSSAKIRLVAVDRSESMVQSSKQTLDSNFVPCYADGGTLPFKDRSFDAVLCTGVLMHLPNQHLALKELVRVLRPGGRLLVSGNNLLSPFALPVMAWVLLKSGPRQSFRFPWFYLRNFTKLGIELQTMVGDTLMAVGLAIPALGISVLPRVLFPALSALDRWVDRPPLNYFAYEIWFLGLKTR